MIDPISITPLEYEQEVKKLLEALGADLSSFRSNHREVVSGTDGEYEIDVTVRFQALNSDFLVLVECKHQTNPVKRDVVQVLHDRLRSTGAQKAILFATAGFQRGALEYAQAHGIALVHFTDGATAWRTKSVGPPTPPAPWAGIPKYVGWWTQLTDEGAEQRTILSVRDPTYFRTFLDPSAAEIQ